MVSYGFIAAYIALACGLFFFFGYAVRYYLYVAILLLLNVFRKNNRDTNGMVTRPSLQEGLTAEPLVSIHLPVYNEPNVVERLLTVCTTLDYRNYEVILVDDSTDNTLDTLHAWAETNEVVYTYAGWRNTGACCKSQTHWHLCRSRSRSCTGPIEADSRAEH